MWTVELSIYVCSNNILSGCNIDHKIWLIFRLFFFDKIIVTFQGSESIHSSIPVENENVHLHQLSQRLLMGKPVSPLFWIDVSWLHHDTIHTPTVTKYF